MSTELAIEIKGLVKDYGQIRALRGLDLEVQRGEIFGFLGPNGAGKTTTIRCLLDLIRPNGGTARVLGLDPQLRSEEVRFRVGYLPGEIHFFDNMKVEAALRYFNRLRGGQVEPDTIHQLAGRLGLDLEAKIKNLSKGNKQKVGVVQAFMHRPELLMLDEPTAGLDPLVQKEVLRMVAEAREAGATVFFSSHILSEVEEAADRVGIIRQGVLVEIAETAELTRRSLHRVEVRFQQPVDLDQLARVPGIKLLSQEDGIGARLQIEGEMDELIKTLAGYPVSWMETEKPSLEEVFRVYYE